MNLLKANKPRFFHGLLARIQRANRAQMQRITARDTQAARDQHRCETAQAFLEGGFEFLRNTSFIPTAELWQKDRALIAPAQFDPEFYFDRIFTFFT